LKSGGFFNVDGKACRVADIDAQLQQPEVWRDQEAMAALQRERSRLTDDVRIVNELSGRVDEAVDFLTLATLI
jgi:protein subunit release factor A